MRVMHFLVSMKDHHDGVTQVVRRLREEFLGTSSRHCFVAPILPPEPEEDLIRVPSVPFPFSTGYRLSSASSQSIKLIIQKFKPDFLHIHTPCTLGYTASKVGNQLGIPMVGTYHTHFPSYAAYYHVSLLKPLIWKLVQKIYKNCQSIIVPSQDTLLDLRAHGFEKLLKINHGVDLEQFSPQFRDESWRSHHLSKDQKLIVNFTGRLVWEKNLGLLAKSIKALPEEVKCKIQVIFVGDGPARDQLSKLLPDAIFLGHLSHEELSVAYASSDIFVFPSVTETFGNVTLEAMASGLVPICAKAGGACDLIEDRYSGRLCTPNDTMEFTQALIELIEDDSKRLKWAKMALHRSKDFDWKMVARRYLELYKSLHFDFDPNATIPPQPLALRKRWPMWQSQGATGSMIQPALKVHEKRFNDPKTVQKSPLLKKPQRLSEIEHKLNHVL